MYKSEYYGAVSETYCQNTDVSMQSNQTTVNNLPYWNQASSQQQQQQQQHQQQNQQSSPNHLNYGSNAAYGNQHTDTVYHVFQANNTSQNVYQSNQNFNGAVNNNNVSSQDVYQYSPYSGDLLQPEDIFQMDQPIRSANVSSLNSMSASPPATLLDLGSGTIEQKAISYSHSELSDSYYSLNDDNSTHSSHNTDPNCFYQNINDAMHLHNGVSGNHNNNNPNMISMNAMDASSSPNAAHSFEHGTATHATYYCDTRNESADLSRQYAKQSPTMLSPNQSPCDRIAGVNYPNACYTNNNNNNNHSSNNNNNNNNNNNAAINNNIHDNFKNQKRVKNEAFAPSQTNQFNSFNSNLINHHEYYGNGSVEHLSSNLTNLELQRNHEIQPQYTEYCNDPVLSNSHGNQCLTYYDSETNNLVQLSTNSYEISVVSSN